MTTDLLADAVLGNGGQNFVGDLERGHLGRAQGRQLLRDGRQECPSTVPARPRRRRSGSRFPAVTSLPLPSYDELPVAPGAPAGSSWGLWGPSDTFGCLNLLTPERVTAGLACAVRGAVFNLNLEMELPGPPLFSRSAFEHVVHDFTVGHDDELSGWNTQSSSQWDGFRHMRHPVYGHYNGVRRRRSRHPPLGPSGHRRACRPGRRGPLAGVGGSTHRSGVTDGHRDRGSHGHPGRPGGRDRGG